LDNNTEELGWGVLLEELGVVADDDFQVEELGLGLDDCLGRYEHIFVEEDLLPLSLVDVIAHIQGLPSSAPLVQ
jgi:hypothetical protein